MRACATALYGKGQRMNETKIPKISKRLEAAASFVRRGARIADIGTDHAYLPIYLYAAGLISGGVAADINAGPCQRARDNVGLYGVDGAISVLQTDGLCGIENFQPDDVFILGMGGELIVKILSDASWARDAKYRFILQPMTHAERLREYLLGSGFSIVDELLVKDEKIYVVICAEYTGRVTSQSEIELLLGSANIERGGALFLEYIRQKKDIYEKRICGKAEADADSDEEKRIIFEIDKLQKKERSI